MKDLSITQKRCFELARVIRDGSSGLALRQSWFISYCGSSGCIAGHAVFLYNRELWDAYRKSNGRMRGQTIFDEAIRLLGLSIVHAQGLFFDYGHTPETAAAALEALAMEQVDA